MINMHFLAVSISIVFAITSVAQTDTTASSKNETSIDGIIQAVDSIEEARHNRPSKLKDPIDRPVLRSGNSVRSIISASDSLHLYDESFNGLSILDSAIQGKRVFITGENHTYTESNARLWLKMIKYLYANAGVRNVMFEYGYSYGFLVNEYLKTGDTTLFNSFDQFAYDEYSQAIKELKVFNDSLPENEKLYFSAIDIERGVYPISKILSHLLPISGEPSDSISLHVQSIKSLSSYNDFKLDREDDDKTEYNYSPGFEFKTNATLNLVHENFLKFEKDYQTYLGANFEEFKKIIVTHYLARKQWLVYDSEGVIQEYIYRENFMHKRFLEEEAQHPGNWFGQFGRCHTTQSKQNSNSCEWFDFNSLANRIKNTPGGMFQDKLMSIAIIYDSDRYTSYERKTVEKEFDKFFDDLEDNSIVLLDMSKDSSIKSAFDTDFNFIFLNKYDNEESSDAVDDYEDLADYEGNETFKLLFGLSYWPVDLHNLEFALLPLANYVNFPSRLTNLQFTISSKLDKRIVSGSSIGWYPKEVFSTEENPDISYTLSHFYVSSFTLFDLVKNSDVIDLMAGIGFTYANMKFEIAEENSLGLGADAGYLGEIKNTIYTNPAFLGDLRFAVDINIGRFTLGAVTANTLDISKKEWFSGSSRLFSGPSTSFSGIQNSIHIGFNF